MGTAQSMGPQGRGGCHAPAAAPGSWSPCFPPEQAMPGSSTAPIIPPGILPAPSPVPTAHSSPRSPPWHHPHVALAWGGRCKQQPPGLGSPGSAGCPQPASPPTPRCCPQPCVTSAERRTAISVTRRADAGHKAEDVGHGSGAGSWLLLLPPLGLGLCSQRSSRYRCSTCSNHRLQSSETPAAPLGEEGRGPAGRWRR